MSDMSPSRADTPPIPAATPYDLTTCTDVISYLAHSPTLPGKRFESITATRMTGGYCNFVYRLQLCRPVDDGKCTAVLKHAETWLSRRVDLSDLGTTGRTEAEGDGGDGGGWEFDLARQVRKAQTKVRRTVRVMLTGSLFVGRSTKWKLYDAYESGANRGRTSLKSTATLFP